MIFLYGQYLLPLGLFFLCFAAFIWKTQHNFSVWIQTHWFYRTSRWGHFSIGCYLAGIFLLLLALLDFRGPLINQNFKTHYQRTILLLDVSSSMLVEDMGGQSRLKKAIFLARHFVKNAQGHRIAIYLFANSPYLLIPFTDDYELLDSRLASLEQVELGKGGTNLNLALKEAMQYLGKKQRRNISSNLEEQLGNILLISDGENLIQNTLLSAETLEDAASASLPQNAWSAKVHMGFVGLGTKEGGKIPLRTREGSFLSYKKFQNEEIISKFNTETISQLQNQFPNFNFYAYNSTPLTAEILAFLRQGQNATAMAFYNYRSVYAPYLILPGILLLVLSFLLRRLPRFIFTLVGCLYFSQLLLSKNIIANAEDLSHLDGKSALIWEKFKKGNLDLEERLQLAQELAKEHKPVLAAAISAETLQDIPVSQKNLVDYTNMGTYFLAQGNLPKSIAIFAAVKKYLASTNFEVKEKAKYEQLIRNNMLVAVAEQLKKDKNPPMPGSQPPRPQDNENEQKSAQSSGPPSQQQHNSQQNMENEKNKKRKEIPENVSSLMRQILNMDQKSQRMFLQRPEHTAQLSQQKLTGEHKDW